MKREDKIIAMEFVDSLDEEERLFFIHTLHRMKAAKSRSWATRYLREFDDWFRERRGMERDNRSSRVRQGGAA